jgi:hypothetical protein
MGHESSVLNGTAIGPITDGARTLGSTESEGPKHSRDCALRLLSLIGVGGVIVR